MSRDLAVIRCPCGGEFEVPSSLRGGIANCPKCRRAVKVPGGFEPLFWALIAGGSGATVILAAIIGWFHGIEFGVGVLVAGFVAIGLSVILS